MSRRLVSFMVRMKGGPTIGGSGTRVYVYDDEALTVTSTLYRRATGSGEQPNPISPNAGVQTTLRADADTTDTVLAVVSIAGFAVGDLVPIYDGTNTVFRVITALNAVGPTMTVDQALGQDFDVDDTFVNRTSMRGHVWFYVEDTRDYHLQPYDVGSQELMPPLVIPTQTPVTTIEGFDEGVSVASRGRIDFVGPAVTLTDDTLNGRLKVTISGETPGDFKPWLTDTPPTNWLLCHGQAISRSTYAALFAVIGTTFGVGDGSTTFNVPDVRGRVLVGQDDMGGSAANRITAANAIGVVGGAATHTLTTSEIPSHSHSHNHGSHRHRIAAQQNSGISTDYVSVNYASLAGNPSYYTYVGYTAADRDMIEATTPSTDATTAGSGGSHNIVQPYVTVNWIIRT